MYSLRLKVLAVAFLIASGSSEVQAQTNPTPEQQALINRIHWQNGPVDGKLGSIASIKVPAGFKFVNADGAQALLELYGNPPAPHCVGAIAPVAENEDWLIEFTYQDTGHINDDEKDSIDANGILASIKAGTERANKERAKRGGSAMKVIGWDTPPFYDTEHRRLSWAIRGQSDTGFVVNYNSRLLGREGVMSANLIADPDELSKVMPKYNQLLTYYTFNAGQTYNEFRAGDKVAAYGLGALVAGGAAVAAVKSGVLGKLIKPIIVGVIAVGGAIAAFFKKLFGQTTEQ